MGLPGVGGATKILQKPRAQFDCTVHIAFETGFLFGPARLSPHRNTMCTHRRVVSTMPTLSFPTGMFCAPPLWCSVFEVVASRACRVPRRFKTRWQVRMVAPRIRMVGKGPGWSRTKLAKYPLTDPVKRPEVELSEVPAGHA